MTLTDLLEERLKQQAVEAVAKARMTILREARELAGGMLGAANGSRAANEFGDLLVLAAAQYCMTPDQLTQQAAPVALDAMTSHLRNQAAKTIEACMKSGSLPGGGALAPACSNSDPDTMGTVLDHAAGLARDALREAREDKPRQSPEDWVCPECGSDEIHATAWVDLRTGLDTGDEGPLSDYWCCQCGDHIPRLIQRKEWQEDAA